MPPQKLKIVFLVGPTAVGKSVLALSLAKRLNLEIVSCDSMQVYKGMDILSSKPAASARRVVRHHLLDVVACKDEFNAASYRKLALKVIRDIHKRGNIPLFVGGTGLYMSVVIDGIFKDLGKDDKLRSRLYSQAQGKGRLFLYNKLLEVDSLAASKIHPNDLKRIIRALEVYKITGKPISELQKTRRGLSDKYNVTIIGLNKDRQDLYNSINKRVDEMFEEGAVEEVKKLLASKLSLTCRQAIGVREIEGFLKGQYDIEEAKERIKLNTRHYSRRQMTWFRKDKRIVWVDAGDKDILKNIIRVVKG